MGVMDMLRHEASRLADEGARKAVAAAWGTRLRRIVALLGVGLVLLIVLGC